MGHVLDKVGMHAQDTSELFFDDVRVNADRLLGGAEGQGFFQLMSDLPYERLIIGVSALATMEGAYESTLAYVRERKAFGKPIAEQQNTKFKLAEIATQIKVGRRVHRPLCARPGGGPARHRDRVDGQALGLGDAGAGWSMNACSCSVATAT